MNSSKKFFITPIKKLEKLGQIKKGDPETLHLNIDSITPLKTLKRDLIEKSEVVIYVNTEFQDKQEPVNICQWLEIILDPQFEISILRIIYKGDNNNEKKFTPNFSDLENDFSNLDNLYLKNIHLTNNDIDFIEKNFSITTFSLLNITFEKSNSSDIYSRIFNHKNIVSLSITELWDDNDGIIKQMEYLQNLCVIFCDKGFNTITQFPKLSQLSMKIFNSDDISSNGIQFANLEKFAKSPIEILTIDIDSVLMERFLIFLKMFRGLRKLTLNSIVESGNMKYEITKLPEFDNLKVLELKNFYIPVSIEDFDIGKGISSLILISCKHRIIPQTGENDREISPNMATTIMTKFQLSLFQCTSSKVDYLYSK